MNLPSLQGNWVDLGIILIVSIYLFGGWRRGFFLGVIDLGGLLLSFFIALKLYSFLGGLLVSNFNIPRGIANACGFLLGGILAEFVFSIIFNFFIRKFYFHFLRENKDNKKIIFLFRIDRFIGFIPALGEALIFTAFILTLLVSLPIQGVIKKDIITSKIGGPLVKKTQGVERELNLIFGQAVNETLTFLTISPNPSSSDKIDLYFTQKEVETDESAEATMLSLINKERTDIGLRSLSLSWQLRDFARDYARDMFARGYFSHYNPENQSPFDRMELRKIQFNAAGENLALAPNVNLAHQGLMNSTGHRANILSPDFTKVGIGVIDGGIYGEMFVQEFTN